MGMTHEGLTITNEDAARLIPLLENAIAEVEAAGATGSLVVPDDALALMASDDWGRNLLGRLREALHRAV